MRLLRVALVLIFIILLSCSSAKKDYERLQVLQSEKEQLLQKDYNYQMKIRICDEIIDSLRLFQSKHPKDDLTNTVANAISTWDSRKIEFAREKDYENVMKIQQASEQSQGHSNDFDVKLRCFDDAIAALSDFIGKYPQDESKNILETALASWKNRKIALENEVSTLYENAYKFNERNAKKGAQLRHTMSDITDFSLINRRKEKQGDNIIIYDEYSVRMVGRIFGSNIYNFKVNSTATISLVNKLVSVQKAEIFE